MQRYIKLDWFYPYPVATIWKCLTDPEILKQWAGLIKKDFKPEVGFKWMETSPPRPALNWDGKMYFEVMEVVPLEKLVYSFKGGPSEGVYNLDTTVTWTLVAKNGGTELQLVHGPFEGGRMYFASYLMEMGWKSIYKRLNKVVKEQFV